MTGGELSTPTEVLAVYAKKTAVGFRRILLAVVLVQATLSGVSLLVFYTIKN